MDNYKSVLDMTEEEVRQYVQEWADESQWNREFVELELSEGSNYRQIAFFLQTN